MKTSEGDRQAVTKCLFERAKQEMGVLRTSIEALRVSLASSTELTCVGPYASKIGMKLDKLFSEMVVLGVRIKDIREIREIRDKMEDENEKRLNLI